MQINPLLPVTSGGDHDAKQAAAVATAELHCGELDQAFASLRKLVDERNWFGQGLRVLRA